MPTLDSVASLQVAIQFAAWVLAVHALAHAVFRSFPALEFAAWYGREFIAPRRERLHRLQWELDHKAHYDVDVAKKLPTAVRRPLTGVEFGDRLAAFRRLRAETRAGRAIGWLLSCGLCQAFWVALGLLAVFAPPATPAELVAAAAAYAGAVSLLQPAGDTPAAEAGGCPSCGRKRA